MEDRCRAEFEEWAKGAGFDVTARFENVGRLGQFLAAKHAQEGWQAAMERSGRSELLEALKEAREFADTVHDGEYGHSKCTRDELVERFDALIQKYEPPKE